LYNVSVDNQVKSLIKEKDRFKEHQVKSRELIHYSNGEKIRTTQFFNTDGLVTKISREIKGKVHSINYSYDESNNVIEIESTNSKNEKWRTQYYYDKENRLIGRDTYDKKGEYSGFKSGYNNDGKILFQEIYKKSKTIPVQSLFYDYYEGGSKKSTTYKKKGKVKYVWNYDCKPEGELINVKNKAASTICIKEELDKDGNRVVWERTFNDKGKLTKVQKVFRIDSTIISKKVFNPDDRLTSETTYQYFDDKEQTEIENVIYPKDGESYMNYKKLNKFNGSFTTYYNEKGEVNSTSEYLVNTDGQVIKSERTGKWGNTFLYYYKNGLKISEVMIFRKSTTVNEFVYSFYEK
jgi:YD repeat-containing protein